MWIQLMLLNVNIPTRGRIVLVPAQFKWMKFFPFMMFECGWKWICSSSWNGSRSGNVGRTAEIGRTANISFRPMEPLCCYFNLRVVHQLPFKLHSSRIRLPRMAKPGCCETNTTLIWSTSRTPIPGSERRASLHRRYSSDGPTRQTPPIPSCRPTPSAQRDCRNHPCSCCSPRLPVPHISWNSWVSPVNSTSGIQRCLWWADAPSGNTNGSERWGFPSNSMHTCRMSGKLGLSSMNPQP